MCGIVGILSAQQVQRELYDALTVLQHRGQDAAGMAVSDGVQMRWRKDLGLVRDVFQPHHIADLSGTMGIGHVRYPTAGNIVAEEAQPLYVNVPWGISLAHNGNLVNAADLRRQLKERRYCDLRTGSDSEILLNVLAQSLQKQLNGGNKLDSVYEYVFAAVAEVMQQCRGAYSVVALLKGVGLLAFRDPMGIRPLCIGQRTEEDGSCSYMVASESAALQALDFELTADVLPGQAVLIQKPEEGSEGVQKQIFAQAEHRPCIFEWVYLARPDSMLDGASVYQSRLNMGTELAKQVRCQAPEIIGEVDAVIPIPECSTACASQLAAELEIPYREAFVKNRYIGRTFIMPYQEQRRRSVRQKLNPLETEFRGKSVLLVDDSIVRGTTCRELIHMARKMGAKKVFFASAAPPIRHANVFGIDMPSSAELIAHKRDPEQVRVLIGADRLIYQRLDGLTAAVNAANTNLKNFELSIFDGDYPMDEVHADYLIDLAEQRGDKELQRSLQLL